MVSRSGVAHSVVSCYLAGRESLRHPSLRWYPVPPATRGLFLSLSLSPPSYLFLPVFLFLSPLSLSFFSSLPPLSSFLSLRLPLSSFIHLSPNKVMYTYTNNYNNKTTKDDLIPSTKKAKQCYPFSGLKKSRVSQNTIFYILTTQSFVTEHHNASLSLLYTLHNLVIKHLILSQYSTLQLPKITPYNLTKMLFNITIQYLITSQYTL